MNSKNDTISISKGASKSAAFDLFTRFVFSSIFPVLILIFLADIVLEGTKVIVWLGIIPVWIISTLMLCRSKDYYDILVDGDEFGILNTDATIIWADSKGLVCKIYRAVIFTILALAIAGAGCEVTEIVFILSLLIFMALRHLIVQRVELALQEKATHK